MLRLSQLRNCISGCDFGVRGAPGGRGGEARTESRKSVALRVVHAKDKKCSQKQICLAQRHVWNLHWTALAAFWVLDVGFGTPKLRPILWDTEKDLSKHIAVHAYRFPSKVLQVYIAGSIKAPECEKTDGFLYMRK